MLKDGKHHGWLYWVLGEGWLWAQSWSPAWEAGADEGTWHWVPTHHILFEAVWDTFSPSDLRTLVSAFLYHVELGGMGGTLLFHHFGAQDSDQTHFTEFSVFSHSTCLLSSPPPCPQFWPPFWWETPPASCSLDFAVYFSSVWNQSFGNYLDFSVRSYTNSAGCLGYLG